MAKLGLTPKGEARIPISGAARSEFGTMLQGATKIYLSNLINTVARENIAKTDSNYEKVKAGEKDARLSKETKQTQANIGAGKSSLMFSKTVENSLQADGDHNTLLNIQFSKKHRQAYEDTLKKRRPLLDNVPNHVDNLFKWVDSIDIPVGKKSKFEKLGLFYMANGYVILPEDGYKILEVDRIASAKKIDPYSYKNPNELLEKFSGEVKAKRVNPDTVKTFSNKEVLDDGTTIYNVEMTPGKGGQMARSAGNGLTLMAIYEGKAQLKMPSSEIRVVSEKCMASIGVPSNPEYRNIRFGKAGRKRHMGIRPTVRGSVMNPNDHPHGGGEGRTSIGRPSPMTPWGKPALGYKTRKKNKHSSKYIVRKRDGSK
jgi:hypothetical protein